MKRKFGIMFITACLLLTSWVNAQEIDKSKRLSLPATVRQVISSGATITIDYSQPSVKGRVIGKDVEPKEGIVWRTGANEATVFETDKAVKINGQPLPAGEYGLFTISAPQEWIVIFSKNWNQWGAFDYKQSEDILRVKIKPAANTTFSEKMTFTIDKNGVVSLLWGDILVAFNVQ